MKCFHHLCNLVRLQAADEMPADVLAEPARASRPLDGPALPQVADAEFQDALDVGVGRVLRHGDEGHAGRIAAGAGAGGRDALTDPGQVVSEADRGGGRGHHLKRSAGSTKERRTRCWSRIRWFWLRLADSSCRRM